MLIAVRRSTERSACSLGFKPILSYRADCRSPADGGVHASGGVAVEMDEGRHYHELYAWLLLFDCGSGSPRTATTTSLPHPAGLSLRESVSTRTAPSRH